MKVNYISHTFYPAIEAGGPVISTYNTVKELAALDINILVSTSNLNDSSKKMGGVPNKKITLCENVEVKYYNEYNFGRFSISFSQIANLWNDIKSSDIVHIQGVFNTISVIGLIYSNFLNKKVVISSRGSFSSWGLQKRSIFKKYWLNLFIKPFIKKSIWHVTSEEEENDIKSYFLNTNTIKIPNGISLYDYKNINLLNKSKYMKKYTGIDFEPNRIIVSMGRIHDVKGFDILISAFDILIKSFPNSVLLVAGTEGDKKEITKKKLLKQVKSLRLEKNVYFVGQLENQDKVDFLANADLFCLPSHSENFGNVYVESLASGTPIIASTNTPWSEVEKYNCGMWVKNNVSETSNAMIKVLELDSNELKENSKSYAKNFSWQNIAIKFKNIYKEIQNDS